MSTPLLGEPNISASDHKKIGILILAYNAASTVEGVLERIPAHIWRAAAEVAVFDDASEDETQARALDFKTAAGYAQFTVMKNDRNLGYGGNQKQGYRYFMDKGFDVVVMLHGDGQHAPEYLGDLYAPLLEGSADAVFGSRMMPRYGGALKGGMPLYKFLGNRLLTLFENITLGLHLTEFHSGYRAYSLAALRQIDFTYMTDDFHFDTEIIIKLHHQGFRLLEIPVPTFYGDEISRVNGLKYARNVVRAVFRYRRTINARARYPEFAEYAPRRSQGQPD